MKQFSLFTLLIFGICITMHSQDYMRIADSMQGSKFSEIIEVIDKSWEGKYTGKHSGYKQYQRWKYRNQMRLDKNGYMQNTAERNWNEFYNGEKKAAYKTSSFQGNWTSLGTTHSLKTASSGLRGFPPPNGKGMGRVNCIALDPANDNIIYAGTPGGGLWRSTDAGDSWNPLTDGMPRLGISGIAIDPLSPENNRTIYILTGDGDGKDTPGLGVYKSVDNGEYWYSTGLGSEASYGYKLLMHPTDYNTLYVVSVGGIFKTTNGGVDWSQLGPNEVFVDIEFNSANPNTMYASTYNGNFYRSTDAGANWTLIMSLEPHPGTPSRVAIGVTPDDPNYVYALYGGYQSSTWYIGFYLSTDGGLTFNLQSDSPNIMGNTVNGGGGNQSHYDLAIAVSPTDKNEVHVGGINCFKSTDAGVTWANTAHWEEADEYDGNYTHADIHALEFYNGILYCGSDGGVFYSDNNAEDWIDITAGLEITQFYKLSVSPTHPEVIIGGAQDNGSLYVSGDTLKEWAGGDGMNCIVDPKNPEHFYGSAQNGQIFHATKFKEDHYIGYPIGAGSGAWVTPFELVTHPTESMLYIGRGKNVYKHKGTSSSGQNLTNDQLGPFYIHNLAVAPSNYNTIYISKWDSLYVTFNEGADWTNITQGLPDIYINHFAVHPYDDKTVWLCNSAGVYKTTDGGLTWNNINGNLPDYSKNCLIYQQGSNDRIYVGTDAGIYYIDNSTSDWVSFSEGLVNVEISDLDINYTDYKIRAATYGRGFWESDLFIDCEDPMVVKAPVPAEPSSYMLKSTMPSAIESITIQAENFLTTGGTYDDTDDGGPGYGASKEGYYINYVNSDDWVEYDVTVQENSVYRISYDIASPSDDAQIQIQVNGVTLSTTDVPNTGGWENYNTIQSLTEFTLPPGTHKVRLVATGTDTWQWNLDDFTFTPISYSRIEVTGVSVLEPTVGLNAGLSYQIHEQVTPSNAPYGKVFWSSDNEAVATVSPTGYVTGQSVGTANITVTTFDGGYTATSLVTVAPTPVIFVSLPVTDKTLFPGEQFTLEEYVFPEDATDKTVTWSSNNNGVATVNSNGIVTAAGIGTATITVTTNDGGHTATCAIIVADNGLNPLPEIVIEAEDFVETGGDYNDGFVPYGVNRTATNINYVNGGDWAAYNLTLAVGGTYEISYSISTPLSSSTISISLDGEDIATDDVINNGEWDDYYYLTSSTLITLQEGDNRIVISGGLNDWQWNLDKIKFTLADTDIHVTGVTFAESQVDVYEGISYQLTPIISPEDATDKSVTWSSDNEDVATVDENGLVRGVSQGNANVTVVTNDGSYSATCAITVIAVEYTFEIDATVGFMRFSEPYDIGGTSAVKADVGRSAYYDLPQNYPAGSYKLYYTVNCSFDGVAIETKRNNDDVPVSTISTLNTGGETNFVTVTSEETFNLERNFYGPVHFYVNPTITGPEGAYCYIHKIHFLRLGDVVIEPIPVDSIQVYPDSLTLEADKIKQLSVYMYPYDATEDSVVWSSSNPAVAIVDAEGVVTAISEGVAEIKATSIDGGHEASCIATILRSQIIKPIVIEAEDFTVTDGPFEGFRLYQVGDIVAINHNQKGDYAEYEVTIHDEGKYKIEYLLGTTTSTGGIQISVNGQDLFTDAVPNNGNWDEFVSLEAGKYIEFEEGTYTIRLTGNGTVSNGWEWNMDKFILTQVGKVCEYSYPQLKATFSEDLTGKYAGPIPGVIEEREIAEEENMLSGLDGMSLYPNPAKSQITIDFNVAMDGAVSIQILNVIGEVQDEIISNEVYKSGNYQVRYNVEQLDKGVYIVKLNNGENSSAVQMVIE